MKVGNCFQPQKDKEPRLRDNNNSTFPTASTVHHPKVIFRECHLPSSEMQLHLGRNMQVLKSV